MHTCDNPACVNPGHLRLGAHQDNVDDMVAKGRQAHGRRNGQSKLTPDAVTAIRIGCALGTPRAVLAHRFGVGVRHIGKVVRGESWRHV